MNLDRNTVIGFVLLAVLLFLYLFFSTKNSRELEAQRLRHQDSIATVHRQDSIAAALRDTTAKQKTVDTATRGLANAGSEHLQVVENGVFRATFTNKGGQPKSVELKKYKSFAHGGRVILNGTDFDKISYAINTAPNQSAQISDLYFDSGRVTMLADSSQVIVFQARTAGGETITHQFTVRPNNYLIDWNLQLNGADKLLTGGALNLTWQSQPVQHESDLAYERQQSNVCFLRDGDFDYIQSRTQKQFEASVQWVSAVQQFFNTTLIAKDPFNSGEVRFTRETTDTTGKIAEVVATLQKKFPLGNTASLPLQLYYGPNDYYILRNAAPQMDKIVNLGRDFYAFVRPINKLIVMPVFTFFKGFVSSMGLAIALLTIFIRLLTSPLMYPGYLTSAKMKILRPELEDLKKKYPDQQKYAMEQMRFTREAGVNTFAGCIPSLLQIPIFFALYSFFNSNIALRGESFLWADNLATYDAIVKFDFNIWGLGNHISLFTLTAAGTSFLISIYNMSMTPDQNNPALKYMPYIFPFMLIFIFNRLPSALTWYYTVSNVITLILQFVIQNYIIDHDKLVAKIEANRKKPKTKSKWQERLEQMQDSQRKMQEAREKSQRK